MTARTKYNRQYYRENASHLSEQRQLNHEKFDRCISYWRQKLINGREVPGLIAGCTREMIDKAEQHYRKLLNEPVETEIKPIEK